MSYRYDSEFLDFITASAGKSASLFIERLIESVFLQSRPSSILDIGCGRGVWLAEWTRHGATRIVGVDGDYVPRETLLIPVSCFQAVNIIKPFDLDERFELVQCLEVAEHVPGHSADTLIDNLANHGDVILFSAAVPGQGGEFHVNERPYSYWRTKFQARGYRMYDAIRPHVLHLRDIEPWYRYNAFVFANDVGANRLSTAARTALVATERSVPTVAPWLWRARCFVISMLPKLLVSKIARLKHRVLNMGSLHSRP